MDPSGTRRKCQHVWCGEYSDAEIFKELTGAEQVTEMMCGNMCTVFTVNYRDVESYCVNCFNDALQEDGNLCRDISQGKTALFFGDPQPVFHPLSFYMVPFCQMTLTLKQIRSLIKTAYENQDLRMLLVGICNLLTVGKQKSSEILDTVTKNMNVVWEIARENILGIETK